MDIGSAVLYNKNKGPERAVFAVYTFSAGQLDAGIEGLQIKAEQKKDHDTGHDLSMMGNSFYSGISPFMLSKHVKCIAGYPGAGTVPLSGYDISIPADQFT